MNPLLETVRGNWARLGIANPQHASSEEIAAFEARYGVKVPPLVREYFTSLNGTIAKITTDERDDHIRFWPLDRVRSVKEEFPGSVNPEAGNWFVFADFLISSWEWALRLSKDSNDVSPVVVVSRSQRKVAESFGEFLERYLKKDENALAPKEDA